MSFTDSDLRDIFAGLAMHGLVVSSYSKSGIVLEELTKGSHDIADAMMAERRERADK